MYFSIVHISKEGVFARSELNEDTELVVIDEWSKETMHSDVVKTVLQGGSLTIARKLKDPCTFNSKVPFYITTNKIPDFGDDDVNVRRRLRIFNTTY